MESRKKWVDLLGVLGSLAIVLIAWRGVVFEGRSFDGSSLVSGVNGVSPPTGVNREALTDPVRFDLGASSWATTPWAEITNRELKQAVLPLWNPYQAAGSPHAANMQASVFDPLLLLVNIHPTPLTWDLTILFTFLLASVATYAFFRNLELDVVAAMTGAAAYCLCGFYVMNNNNSFARTYAYIPILLLAVDKIAESSRLRWVAALAGAIAATILAGMPEAAFFCLSLAALYALYRILTTQSRGRFGLLLSFGGSGLLGLALAAPLLLLFLQYLPLSFNVHGSGAGLVAVSRTTLLNWFAPMLAGHPNALYSDLLAARSWCGAAVFVLALVAISSATARRRDAWWFLGVGLIVMLKIHGFPGVQWLGQLPFADRSVWHLFAAPAASFALAAAAAIGVQTIAEGKLLRQRFFIISFVVLVLLGILFVKDLPFLHPAPPGAVMHSVLLAAAIGAIVAATALAAAKQQWRRFAVVVALLTVVVELLLFIPVDNLAQRAEPFATPPWLRLLEDRSPEDRIFGFDNMLYPNTAGALGIQDVRTLDALYINRYLSYVQNFVTPFFTDRFTGEGVSPYEIASNRMFDLLGVRYIVARNTAASFAPATFSQFERIGDIDGVSVYRNKHVIPRAFVASDVRPVDGSNEATIYLQSLGHRLGTGSTRVDRFDPESQAVVETQSAETIAAVRAVRPAAAGSRPVRIVSYAPDRVEIQVAAGAPGLLVLTDTFFPGWVATVNGKMAGILPTDVAFRGVALSSEAATVVFRYSPRTGVLGMSIAGIGIAVFLIFCLLQRNRSV